MTDTPPSNPEINDVWIDDAGELKYFNGREWAPYLEVADGDLKPHIVARADDD